MNKLAKGAITGLTALVLGANVASAGGLKAKNVGKNLLGAILTAPITVMRTLVGAVSGYDIVRKKQGLPIFQGVECLTRGALDTAEYAVGVIIPYDTNEYGTQGNIDKAFDEAGVIGEMIRGAFVGAGLGAVYSNFIRDVNIGYSTSMGAAAGGSSAGIEDYVEEK